MNILPAINILHTAKHRHISTKEMNALLLSNPKMSRRIGSLPFEWLEKIPKDRSVISNVTEQIHRAFEKFSANTAETRVYDYYSKSATPSDVFKQGYDSLLEVLKNILNREDISIKFSNNGEIKNCSKITVGDKSYALSTFRMKCTDFDNYYMSGHGRGYEPQMQFTAYKRGSHGRIARPFMAKVSSNKDKGGYILSSFIESEHPQKTKIPQLISSRGYIINYNTDKRHYCINGIRVETGGMTENKKYIANPIVRQNWIKLINKIHSEVDFMRNFSDRQKVSDYLLQLKKDGVDLCNSDTREILKDLSPEEQKIGKKYIRILRKTRKLKEELIQNGDFKQYQELLDEDLRDNFKFYMCSREYTSYFKNTPYPQLTADELGVSNIPELTEMVKFVFSRQDVDIHAIRDLYTLQQVKDYLKDPEYVIDGLMVFLSKNFDIEPDIKNFLKNPDKKRISDDLIKYFADEYDIKDEIISYLRTAENPIRGSLKNFLAKKYGGIPKELDHLTKAEPY